MRQMCMCENARCPFHPNRQCDVPAAAKIRWYGILTAMCQQCLDMAVQTNGGGLQIIGPIKARLTIKGAGTGNQTFDRIWSDFHEKMSRPENEDREFHEVLGEHEGKKQVVVALGKLNYLVSGGGFDEWIAEGYAASTGDLLVKKLPHHDHLYPLLSKLRDMLQEILDAYDNYGAKSFADIENLHTIGISRNTLWAWFRLKKKNMFRFRGRVTEPYDLEYISGKWGHIRLDDEALTPELVKQYESELAETEDEIAALKPEGKAAKTRNHLLGVEAELDSVLEALHYRMELQKAWNEFKKGGWASTADKVLDTLSSRYHMEFTLKDLVNEAAELFNATPDDVYPIEQKGEELAEEAVPDEEILKYLDA